MTAEEAAVAQEAIEEQLGLRCGGCGRRITIGFKFTSVAPREQHPVLNLSACNRDDCGFAMECRSGATVMEVFEVAWLDDAGKNARPSPAIVKRAERRAEALAAAEKDAAAPKA